MVMIVAVPSIVRLRDKTTEVEDYLPDLASDSVLREVLVQTYEVCLRSEVFYSLLDKSF